MRKWLTSMRSVLMYIMAFLFVVILCAPKGGAAWLANRASLCLLQTRCSDDETIAWLDKAERWSDRQVSISRLRIIQAVATNSPETAEALLNAPSFPWGSSYLYALRVGRLYWDRGDLELAESVWQRSVQATPAALVDIANAIGRFDSTFALPANTTTNSLLQRLGNTARKYHRLTPDAWLTVGLRLDKTLNDPTTAREWLAAATMLYPDHAGIQRRLLDITMGQQDYNSAWEYFRSFSANPDRLGWIEEYELHIYRGTLLLLQAHPLEAEGVREFQEAVRLAPDSVYAQYRLATALQFVGRTEDALRQFEFVLGLPSQPGVDMEDVRERISELEAADD